MPYPDELNRRKNFAPVLISLFFGMLAAAVFFWLVKISRPVPFGKETKPVLRVGREVLTEEEVYRIKRLLAIPGLFQKLTAPAALQQVPLPAPTPLPRIVSFDDLAGKPSLGSPQAPVTIVEFSDFHCPFCQKVSPVLDRLMKSYPGKIYRVWRNFPLPMHEDAVHTHEAALCANEQGKFWEYHEKLFQTFGIRHSDADFIRLAEDLKLNKKKFEKCLSSGQFRELIRQDIAKGEQSGVNGTPAVFINGKLIAGAYPYEYFDRLVKTELEKNR